MNRSVPHLSTSLIKPLQLIEKHFLENQCKIECWFRQEWQKTRPPIYGSVDLRNAGFKLAPVDMNLFPAGFNNLNLGFRSLCIQSIQATLETYEKNITKILLIPENHTRNLFYLENVSVLKEIIEKSGFEARIGSLIPDLKIPTEITISENKKLLLEPLIRKENRVGVANFDPDLIWLNNDLSSGIPEILQNVEQCIRPPVTLGWSNRLKSNHFTFYDKVTEVFCRLIDIDPWLINPLFRYCPQIDFLKKEGMSCLLENTNFLFNAIEEKYDQYGITEKPFVIVKADAGTYGMSVMTIQDPNDLIQLNRKQRTRMSATKGGGKVERVILQEGVHSFEVVEEAIAEPVVYMIGKQVVGSFYRIHENKQPNESLNSPGMKFKPLSFAKPCNNPDRQINLDDCANRFYAYGVIARLSLLAAAREQVQEEK